MLLGRLFLGKLLFRLLHLFGDRGLAGLSLVQHLAGVFRKAGGHSVRLPGFEEQQVFPRFSLIKGVVHIPLPGYPVKELCVPGQFKAVGGCAMSHELFHGLLAVGRLRLAVLLGNLPAHGGHHIGQRTGGQLGRLDADGDVMGLYDYLTEYENLDELNHLAHLISELDSDEIEALEAALNKGDHTSSVADIINLVHNLDCYDLHPGVTDDETLGRIYVEDMELLDVPDNVQPYFDFEAYGRDMRINEGGHFAPTGYLTRSGDFKEVYHGIEDIPAEHRIFAYPKLNIREQMAAYKEVIDRSSLEGERLHPRKEYDDR